MLANKEKFIELLESINGLIDLTESEILTMRTNPQYCYEVLEENFGSNKAQTVVEYLFEIAPETQFNNELDAINKEGQQNHSDIEQYIINLKKEYELLKGNAKSEYNQEFYINPERGDVAERVQKFMSHVNKLKEDREPILDKILRKTLADKDEYTQSELLTMPPTEKIKMYLFGKPSDIITKNDRDNERFLSVIDRMKNEGVELEPGKHPFKSRFKNMEDRMLATQKIFGDIPEVQEKIKEWEDNKF